MRRPILLGLAALLTLFACTRIDVPGTAATAASATARASTSATGQAPTSDHAAVLIAVLRRYLSTPGENSFPDRFEDVYVFNFTDPQAADPMAAAHQTFALPAEEQAAIADGLADLGRVRFVADRAEVVITPPDDRCGWMRAGAILMTLGEPQGTADRVEVGVSGWVSCTAATWLTYVVERDGGRWRVTGTTGSMAIA